MLKISLITDEISADPETAIELGVQWGVLDFELRGFYTDRVPYISGYQKQLLRNVLDRYQASIIAIGPGLFKVPFPPEKPARNSLAWLDSGGYESWSAARKTCYSHLNELLPASLDYANELGARKIVTFGFDRGGAPCGSPPEEMLDLLRLAAQRAETEGLELVLENEAGFWADTGAHTAELVRLVNHPALKVNWDPGNAYFACDQPFPEGYNAVRPYVRHVHFKDAGTGPMGEPEYLVKGQIDWEGQIRALAADGYEGHISVETHTWPKVAATQALLQRLQVLIAGISGSSNLT